MNNLTPEQRNAVIEFAKQRGAFLAVKAQALTEARRNWSA